MRHAARLSERLCQHCDAFLWIFALKVINFYQRNDSRGEKMLKTITVGTCVSVQGIFVRTLENGKIVVEADGKQYAGTPVSKH